MADPIDRAMILAAGLATRMRPLTDDRPKALIEVAGKTLIDHAIDRLIEAGIRDVVVNLYYCADALEAHLKRRRDIRLTLSDERAGLLDTGGGVLKALPHFSGRPFFTLNGDSLWIERQGNALLALARQWDEEIMDGLMLLCPTDEAAGYDGRGDFEMGPDGRLSRRGDARAAFVWTGVQILHPRLFADCPTGPFSTNLVWDRAIAARRLFGLPLDGIWMHVGTPDAIAPAEVILARHSSTASR